jgi:aspartyl-tRNA(Asn)/glutamyl-tRNA(Gln) amidotransferase subunit B
MNGYQSFIGLEIHIRLLTRTKAFCGCRTAFGDEPNTHVCPVCLGYPGVLPALNREAMEMGYLVARALNCTLAQETSFDRKNYFYPDMPKNYQISQFHAPLGRDGYLELSLGDTRKRIGIHDVHLEEDAGKMIHEGGSSYLDYNRAGTSLLEIVTEPDLETGEEAEEFIRAFRSLVRYLGVCDGNMEEGSLKCDANVSINLRGSGLGVKTEVKNLNSSKFVRKALSYEISRQRKVLESGGLIVQETRLWDEAKNCTESMRSKESAHDYRYFPEPDLPLFRTDREFLERVESRLVELPHLRRERFVQEYSLTDEHASFLCDEKETADFFEEAVRRGADPSTASAWLGADIQRILKRDDLVLSESPMTPGRLAEISALLDSNRINSKIAKQVVEIVFLEDADPEGIVRERGWEQIRDTGAVEKFVDTVISEQPKAVEQIQSGDLKPVGFLIGQVMKMSAGQADPELAKELILRKLNNN